MDRVLVAILCGSLVGALCPTPASADEVLPPTTLIKPAIPIGERDGVPLYRKEILGKVQTVDKIYRSMQGPYTLDYVRLLDGEQQLSWVTGYRAGALSPDGSKALSDEFMCHRDSEGRLFTGHWVVKPGREVNHTRVTDYT